MEEEIKSLLQKHQALLVAHFYQKDAIVNLAHFCGDSLELAKKATSDSRDLVIFCGVGFMGESVKILAPHKRVLMPKISCCSMARMVSSDYYDRSVDMLESYGITDFIPITYINSSAEVKAKVGAMGGMVCTSANAKKIFERILQENKKIFFLPDRCLGENLANMYGLSCGILGVDNKEKILDSQVVCYNGFCSVHQLFTPEDIDFFRENYKDIKIVVHPECKPEVVKKADFVGSTSQIIAYVTSLPASQSVAVGTEFNLVSRLRPHAKENTFVLSSTIPECPTMNETGLNDILKLLHSYDQGRVHNEIVLEEHIRKDAALALERMLEIS
ncbi:quinolinate synthase NadA [Helicobacter anatolicus]|uniref:quinolinate synthase NadA n=1 Tax=Helicobacter anatolicus TaxID=2905874 RepID=UPI001E3F468A|nr:quinolinate synthase NadA [Helicobacter anatolicus]MCE3039155.1 quinolinate synthase NadA [Helicobacter anatolicus]